MNIDIKNINNEKVGEIDVPDVIFAGEVNQPVIQQAVKTYLAHQRQGTACTKTRAEVSGSGRKLWKQKHTGRARVGSIRTPLWRHGGTTFGPRPRDYDLKFPVKMRKLALRSVISSKYQDGKFVLLDQLSLADAKTKSAAAVFKTLGISSALVLDSTENSLARQAMQNLPGFLFAGNPAGPVYDILKHDSLVVTMRALSSLLEVLQ